MIEQVRRLMLGLALAGFTACPGGGKPPQPPTPPTPTPPPASAIKYETLLVRIDGVKLVMPNNPAGFVPFGAVQCCMEAPAEVGNSRWPLASESWMDFTKANMFHFRMGPFYARPGVVDEDEWDDIGGPYLGDGPDFNPAFDSKVQSLLDHAGKNGAVVEVNVIDTWYCKRSASNWGDQQMPWPQADIDACGKQMTPVQERFIRHVVQVTGEYANVIYITDNEGGEIRGTKREWYVAVRDIIRDEEQKLAHPVIHIIGTNNTDFCDGPFDYCATHARESLTQPIAGKHTENNERNPGFSVEEEYANYVNAKAAGLNYWYWRAEQTDANMRATLSLFQHGSSAPVGCFAPAAEDPKWVTPPAAGTVGDSMKAAVLEAEAAVGDRCGSIGPCAEGPGEPEGHHCQQNVTLGLVASKLREKGYCASGPWADAVAVLNPQGLWQEFHVVAFGTGCYSADPNQLPKNTWTYSGANPAPVACTGGTEAVDQISCKEHQATNHVWDCTPKIKGRPVRPEGDPERDACEREACGGNPTFTIQPPLVLFPRDNPYQFRLSGTGSGLLTSTCPRTGGDDLTSQVVNQP